MAPGGAAGAKQRLMTEMQSLQKEKWVNIDDNITNIFLWRLAILVVNPESAFDGGYFKAEMLFSEEYPYQPPKFKFLIPIYHPNIYPDGQLCISILHKPGEDLMSGEDASERWSPLQGVESVLRSVLLLLDDPEINSPANVDAGVLYRDNREEYNRKAAATVARSRKDIPNDFVFPATIESAPPQKFDDDDGFWAESDEDFDFGGSDTGDDDQGDMGDFEEDGGEEQDESDDDKVDERAGAKAAHKA